MPIKPITPDEALALKFEKFVPEEVLDAANELIAKNLDSYGTSRFKQDDLVKLIRAKMGKKIAADKLFDNGWLDIEPYYRDAGWKVTYDKPAYNESYAATFEFSKKK